MLVQMVGWGILPTSAAARANGADAIVICTAEGLKRIVVGSDGQALPDDGRADGQTDRVTGGHCPLCPIVGGAGLPPPPATASSPDLIVIAIVPGDADDAPPERWLLSGCQARAPPAI